MASAFLESLSSGDRAALVAAGHGRRWGAGEALLRRGDPADSAIVVLEGLAKVHRLGPEGTDVMLGFSGPGDLLGEISAVRATTRSATVTAVLPVAGVVIPSSALRAFLVTHPEVTLALLDLSLTRLYVADFRRVEFASAETLARVASRLVELAERFGDAGADGQLEVALPFTQDDLASWSSASRESTGRALRRLRDLRLITTARQRFTVLDLPDLRRHAGRE